ncbi:hypothetical protein B566_EDAN015283 [Ephemera danica]|nr:hypothetical protein B566_EDAN015283 [Ephemera danica]
MLCACRRAALTISTRFASSQPRALRPKKGKSHGPRPPRGLVDMKTVTSVGGRGGDGCVSFLSVWCNAEAGPDGGDGGNGGDVILQASTSVKDLHHVHSTLKGNDGIPGSNKNCYGANAKPLVVPVPLGTIVRKGQADGEITADLEAPDTQFVAARGGLGGKGNKFFTTDTNQCPEVAEIGGEGERNKYTLEIRSIAHIGLIGFPNAGKSTLLQAITRARPKVAPYPFTTLQPYLGVIPFSDYQQVIVADLPGLITDAHLNRGLGHAFLRHTTRCLALMLVIDLAQEWPQPIEELQVLRNEIRQYSSAMARERPWAITANKIDLPLAQENLHLLQKELPLVLEKSEPAPASVTAVSGKVGTNLPELVSVMRKLYDENIPDNEDDL